MSPSVVDRLAERVGLGVQVALLFRRDGLRIVFARDSGLGRLVLRRARRALVRDVMSRCGLCRPLPPSQAAELIRLLLLREALFRDGCAYGGGSLSGLRLARLAAQAAQAFDPPSPLVEAAPPSGRSRVRLWREAVAQTPRPAWPPALLQAWSRLRRQDLLWLGHALQGVGPPTASLAEAVVVPSVVQWLHDFISLPECAALRELAAYTAAESGGDAGHPSTADASFLKRLGGAPLQGHRTETRGIRFELRGQRIEVSIAIPAHLAGTGLMVANQWPAYVHWPATRAGIVLGCRESYPQTGLISGFSIADRAFAMHPLVAMDATKPRGVICIAGASEDVAREAIAAGAETGEVLIAQLLTLQTSFVYGYSARTSGRVYHSYRDVVRQSDPAPYRLIPHPEAELLAREKDIELVRWVR